jgi:outer membrane receptor protein involved in Fe transport
MSRFVKVALNAAVSVVCLGQAGLHAQEPEQEPEQESAYTLQEIVVTSQKRAQKAQDVPISLQVVGAEEIVSQGYRSMLDVQGFVPNLVVQDSRNNQIIRIRGVGTQGSNFGFEQAVPQFIDGMHFGRGSQVLGSFLDVERVEVLRGPQPIFFGQNATGGALAISTRKPGKEWDGYVVGEAGNDAIRTAEFGIGGPLSDTFGIRVAGKYDVTEGHLENLERPGDKFPGKETIVGRITARWQPTDALDVIAKIEHGERKGGGPAIQNFGIRPLAESPTGVLLGGTPFAWIGANIRDDNTIDDRGMPGGLDYAPPRSVTWPFVDRNRQVIDITGMLAQLGKRHRRDQTPTHGLIQANYAFDDQLILTSLTGYSHYTSSVMHSFDNSPFALVELERHENLKQWSQEFRLTSPTGGFVEWMAGGYYEHLNLKTDGTSYKAIVVSSFSDNIEGNASEEKAQWLSGFASVTLNPLETLAFDLGGRYTQVKKEGSAWGVKSFWRIDGRVPVHGDRVNGMTPLALTGKRNDAEFTDSDFNPQVAVRWEATPNITFFGKWSEAFKAGGFEVSISVVVPPEDFVFKPETAESWEGGVKTAFWNGRGEANLTVFTSTFENLQLSAFDEQAGRNRTLNVGKQRARGVELDGRFALTEDLTFGVAATLLDSKIVSFPGATCNPGEVRAGLCTGPGGTIDRYDQQQIYAPKWSTTLRTDYARPIFNDRFRFIFNGNLLISDEYLTSDTYADTAMMPSHTRLNLLFGLGNREQTWQVSLWGRNLTEALPKEGSCFSPKGCTVEIGQLRTYGIQLRHQL